MPLHVPKFNDLTNATGEEWENIVRKIKDKIWLTSHRFFN